MPNNNQASTEQLVQINQVAGSATTPTPKSPTLPVTFNVPEDMYNRFCEALPGHGERSIVLRRLLAGWLDNTISLDFSPKVST